MLPLKNRISLVTGSAQGIGKGIAKRLARDGATVVVADLNEDLAQETVEELSLSGGRAVARRLDVSDSSDVDRVFKSVVEEFGKLEILVNNAGVHLVKPITDYTDQDWDFVMNVNARGTFFCLRAGARVMQKQRWGRIVNIVTILTGTPYSSIYEASKHAVMGLTKCLMYELAPYGITVNAVSPGAVDTELLKKGIREKALSSGLTVEDIYRQIESTTPLGRMATPEDIAAAVAFFVSPDGSYVTGEMIHATGGAFHQNLGRR